MPRSTYIVAAVLASVLATVAAPRVFTREHEGRGAESEGREPAEPAAPKRASAEAGPERRADTLRLSGTVEAVQATTVTAPRLQGQNNNSLVITQLIPAGQKVVPGDILVAFDRQDQVRNALDRQADLNDLDQQIKKKQAEEDAARATDDSLIEQAKNAQQRAQLEVLKNDLIPRIDAEKNNLALDEAKAKLAALQDTYTLKREAARADIRVLQIQRGRAENAMRQASANAEKMQVKSPIAGIAVIKTTWKGNSMSEIEEGDEIRPGTPVVDVVNPAAMRVRARVNQADIQLIRLGQRVRVGLDAYPDLSFEGRVSQISPIGVLSSLSPKVRTFVVLVEVSGSHPNLMPDLTASLDVDLGHPPAYEAQR